MKSPTFKTVTLVTIFACIACQQVYAAANTVPQSNLSQSKAIQKIINQHISLKNLKNQYFHPLMAKTKSSAVRNPFASLPKAASDNMRKSGINLSAIARYRAIRLGGEYLGASSKVIVHNDPNVVLVIGANTLTHDPIYSRGPVYVEGKGENLSGIVSNNLVWFNKETNNLPRYGTFIGMPAVLRGNTAKPIVETAPQYKLNRLVQTRRQECNSYVRTSLKQNKQNKTLGCGYKGSRWSDDWNGQFNWCVSVLEPQTIAEDGARKDLIEACKKAKVSPSNPQNKPAVPAQCTDPSKQYGAVTRINHYFRYDQAPKAPVQNGLIRYDYNQDNQSDYVFLEAKGDRSRVVICMSNGNRYQRHITDIQINSSSGFGSYDYDITQNGALLEVDVQYFEHNAGSSYSKTSYQYQPNTRKFKITKTESDAYGVEMDGMTYPMSTPPSPKLY